MLKSENSQTLTSLRSGKSSSDPRFQRSESSSYQTLSQKCGMQTRTEFSALSSASTRCNSPQEVAMVLSFSGMPTQQPLSKAKLSTSSLKSTPLPSPATQISLLLVFRIPRSRSTKHRPTNSTRKWMGTRSKSTVLNSHLRRSYCFQVAAT